MAEEKKTTAEMFEAAREEVKEFLIATRRHLGESWVNGLMKALYLTTNEVGYVVKAELPVPKPLITPEQIEAAHKALHPNGACTCGGEGKCEWCKTICSHCGGDGLEPAAPRPLSVRDITGRDPRGEVTFRNITQLVAQTLAGIGLAADRRHEMHKHRTLTPRLQALILVALDVGIELYEKNDPRDPSPAGVVEHKKTLDDLHKLKARLLAGPPVIVSKEG
ncbi:MAG TPA: hypothetical protein VGD87_10645 [Archangium sp.]